MSNIVNYKIHELEHMKKYPEELFYIGKLDLLKRQKISIVGTRKPSNYTREITYRLSSTLAKKGIIIVSGAAMGVDAIAHTAAGTNNTIAVVANGLNKKYPAVNKSLIKSIEKDGLMLSQFTDDFKATPWSFVVRNELVVALGDILIVTEASLDSGSMRSVEYALKMNKKIYVIPHEIGKSLGTNRLLKEGKAEAIYDIDEFCNGFSSEDTYEEDPFLIFCKSSPTFEDCISLYGAKVYEEELNGTITIQGGMVMLS